jgi:CheY-like chemotaxis protein
MIDAATQTSLAHPDPNQAQGRVLIVDDEEVAAGSLQQLLSNEHDAAVVRSGRAALERLCAGERTTQSCAIP